MPAFKNCNETDCIQFLEIIRSVSCFISQWNGSILRDVTCMGHNKNVNITRFIKKRGLMSVVSDKYIKPVQTQFIGIMFGIHRHIKSCICNDTLTCAIWLIVLYSVTYMCVICGTSSRFHCRNVCCPLFGFLFSEELDSRGYTITTYKKRG